MEIDELTGRELDAAIAKRLFGLEVEARTNAKTGELDTLCRQPGKAWVAVGFYSSTLSSSISVELELRIRGWKRGRARRRTRRPRACRRSNSRGLRSGE